MHGKGLLTVVGCMTAVAIVGSVAGPVLAAAEPDWRGEFLALCDATVPIIEKQAQTDRRIGRAFYWDSYCVRALAVAYDLTGNQAYLRACRRWSDRMVQYQRRMIPPGAYYMQYGRQPGQSEGNWYVADCSSIALGVLATAVRCQDPAAKKKYLDSVQAFAKLVIDNFVRPPGGVTDGYWPKSDRQWWCSTGIFGSLAFHLYHQTGDPTYRDVGLGTIAWLNQQDLFTVAVHFPTPEITPTVLMYCLEAYSAAWPHLEPGSERHAGAMAQWAKVDAWMAKNLQGRAGIDYISQWGSKFGGLPYHLYVYARFRGGDRTVVDRADRELRYIADLLKRTPSSRQRDQLALFAMISYAEKLSPGALDRPSTAAR